MRTASRERWEGARRRYLLRWLARPSIQAEHMPQVGGTVGGFTLEARLGAGSFGTVYRARRAEGVYALKLLYLPRAGPWAERELEVLLRLHQVGLVRVECHGHHGPWREFGPLFLYIVTEYVAGPTLDRWTEHTNPTARQVARVVYALAAQLALAHAAGVVHRDLKADNVVMRHEDTQPVLVDFGAGTFSGAAVRLTWGSPPGNAQARAPEAWRFRREHAPEERYMASARDDLWGLGVLFYWLLVGAWPFDRDSREQFVEEVLHVRPRAPHERNPRVPGALGAVCARMLEKASEARYASAEAVCEALKAAVVGLDAAWEVPLCEAWEASGATTWQEKSRDLEQMGARFRRLAQEARVRPRRGRPMPAQAASTQPSPSKGDALPVPGEEPGGERSPPPAPPPEVAVVRTGRRGAWAWVALSLLCSAHLCARPEPLEDSRGVSVPGETATPGSFVSWGVSGREMALGQGPREGDSGAVPSWFSPPAPVALATHSKDDPRMNSSRKNAPSSPEKSHKPNPVGNPVTHALCTGALGALVAGCPGAQVRADPRPEACPESALKAMKQLEIRPHESMLASFPDLPYSDPGESLVTIREGEMTRLQLNRPHGGLVMGTVLVGHFFFGKERVFGRFIEARMPNGSSYPVCIETFDYGSNSDRPGGHNQRGLLPSPASAPGTVNVNANPHIDAVERFE